MSTCVPVRDMRDTAAFTGLVEAEGEVTVTKNGYTAIHCLSDSRYQAMQEEAARSRLLSRIMLAESEMARGDADDFDEFEAGVRERYGL